MTVPQKKYDLTTNFNNMNITESSADTQSNENTDAKDNEEQEPANIQEQIQNLDEQLREALKAQLEYYFSTANLVRDTFLCSVMTTNNSSDIDEESGQKFAPVSVLERFGNIQRIIHHYESQRHHISHSANATDDAIDDGSYYKIIPNLLRDSALLSSSLKVIVLDNDDTKIDDAADSSNSNNESVTSSTDVLTVNVFRLGIGPIQSIWDETEKMKSLESSKEEKKAEKNIIIIRDMPSTATDEEIKDIFQWEGCPAVKSVHSDVGNSWFVSLDGSYDQIVDVLLELRSKKFKGEHDIKARLKTESVAKTTPSMNYYSSQFSGFNNSSNGRPQYYRRSGKFGSTDQYTYRNRYQQSAPYANTSRRPGSDRSGLRGRGHRSGPYGKPMEEKPKVPAVPPPPLEMESHFPALGASPSPGATNSEANEVITDNYTLKVVEGAKEEKEVEGEVAPSVKPVTVPVQAMSQDNTRKSGYAAALLKVAPIPIPMQSSQKQSGKSNATSQLKKKFILTVPFQKGGNNQAKDAKSAASTATTDPADRFSDSSTSSTSAADEKSSTSQGSSQIAKDSEKNTFVNKKMPSWGGKKSFADILKLKEQQKLERKTLA